MEYTLSNNVQDHKNKLKVHSLTENIEDLIRQEKRYSRLYNFLTGLLENKKLYKLNFNECYDYIKNIYSLVINEFQSNKEVSLLSYGLAKII